MKTTQKQADTLAAAVFSEAVKLGFTSDEAQILFNQVWDQLVYGEQQEEQLLSQFY